MGSAVIWPGRRRGVVVLELLSRDAAVLLACPKELTTHLFPGLPV